MKKLTISETSVVVTQVCIIILNSPESPKSMLGEKVFLFIQIIQYIMKVDEKRNEHNDNTQEFVDR